VAPACSFRVASCVIVRQEQSKRGGQMLGDMEEIDEMSRVGKAFEQMRPEVRCSIDDDFDCEVRTLRHESGNLATDALHDRLLASLRHLRDPDRVHPGSSTDRITRRRAA
jgi:hypothetical protein